MKDWRSYGILSQLSWVFALSVLLPLVLAIWLDRILHTSPLFLFIGAVLGIVSGTVGAVRIATRTMAEIQEPREDASAGRKEDEQ